MSTVFGAQVDAVAFPDEGAFKRFKTLINNGMDIVVCGKIRDGNSRKITIHEGNVRGKRVIIIDDLVRSGGTLYECAKALLEQARFLQDE